MGERNEEGETNFLNDSSLDASSAGTSVHLYYEDIHALNNEVKRCEYSGTTAGVLWTEDKRKENFETGRRVAFGCARDSTATNPAISSEARHENSLLLLASSRLKRKVSSAFLSWELSQEDIGSPLECQRNAELWAARRAAYASEVFLSYKWIHKFSVFIASFVIAQLQWLFVNTLIALLLSCVTGVALHFTAAGLLSALGLWQCVEPFMDVLLSVRYNLLLGALALPHLPWLRTHALPMVVFVHVLLIWFTGFILQWTMLAGGRLVGLETVTASLAFFQELIIYYSAVAALVTGFLSDCKRYTSATRGSAIAHIWRALARVCILYLIETSDNAKWLMFSLCQEVLCVFTGVIALVILPTHYQILFDQCVHLLKIKMGEK